jgi:TFIIF-interacting CTD phosphatase-like protein
VSQPLLILDLDETLIYATKSPLDRPGDFTVGPFVVYRRPFLSEFLDRIASHFELAVWTSAGSEYAAEIAAQVFSDYTLRFLWSAARCTQRTNHETFERYTVKDLRKVTRLGFSLERMLMIDDSPEKLERNYGNHIWVQPFEGDLTDSELPRLAAYLSSIRDVPNYRSFEKRHWRNQELA